MSGEKDSKRPIETPKQPNAVELSSTELDQVVGGTGAAADKVKDETSANVVGGALTAGKVALPWA